MNKKEFLNTLEKKLSVLEKDEKQDILIEYTDTINEKIKQGQSEEEAVKDFGNIDDLVKEILKAYKINPDYEEKPDSFVQKSEELIKQGAGAISNLSRSLAKHFNISSKDISLELIFEIIIRIFIVLVGALILKGVFSLFDNLGESIFDNLYDPVGHMFTIIWKLLLMIVYILLCVLIVIAVFKKYFKTNENNIEEVKPKTTIKENKECKQKQVKKTKENKGTSLGDVCLLIVKILVTIYVVVPFIMIDCLLVLSLIASIIYFIKGIDLLGLILLLAGISSLFTYLIQLLLSLLFGKGKVSIIPVIISIVMMIIGGIMFVDMIMNIDYIDKAPNEDKQVVETKTFNTDKKTFIHYGNHYYYDIEKTVDASMPDGQFIIEYTYNKDKQQLKIEENKNFVMDDCEYDYEENYYNYEDEYENYQNCTQSTYYYLNILNINQIDDFNEFKESYNRVIEDLKDNKLYNYSKAYESKLSIKANQKTLDMIRTN